MAAIDAVRHPRAFGLVWGLHVSSWSASGDTSLTPEERIPTSFDLGSVDADASEAAMARLTGEELRDLQIELLYLYEMDEDWKDEASERCEVVLGRDSDLRAFAEWIMVEYWGD